MGIDRFSIAKRKDFLEFDSSDVHRLTNLNELLSLSQRKLIDQFYEHIFKYEDMQKVLSETITLNRLKTLQSDYFSKLTCGHYEWDYVLERLQVGLTHKRHNLDIKWYIGAYRKYLSLLLSHISYHGEFDRQKLTEAFDSVIKIIFFDMGLAIDTYVHANSQTIIDLEEHLEDLIEGIDGFIWEFDVALYKYIYVSPQSEKLLGYKQYQWEQNPEFQRQIVHPDDITLTRLAFNDAIDYGKNQEIEYRIRLQNDEILWVNERISVVKNNDGVVTLLRGLIVDINKRKAYEEQLAFMATYDELTGMPNRNALEKKLKEEIILAEKKNCSLAVLFLDLDGFKYINDSFGHAAGDILLETIARRLSNYLREQDFAARFGGDEFCIIVNNIDEELLVSHIATRLLATVEKSTSINQQHIFPRVSIGIALYPKDGETSEILLQCADNAMYAAKKAGMHRFAFYDRKMTKLAEQHLTLENDLRQALATKQFELCYQPQIDVKSGKMLGVETLIRWRHPERGYIPPDQFIPIAENIGLIIPLGEWVIDQACRQIAQWHADSIHVGHVAINISSSHFCDSNLPNAVKDALMISKISASSLHLEITEEVVQTSNAIRSNFKKIKELGVKIAIDDFGTGYSCLNSLTQLPIDFLKIDKTFIQSMLSDTNYLTIVATIIAMIRAMGFSVIAEGVESRDQVIYLQGVGCHIIQGYYFSKPVFADQIPYLVATNFYQTNKAGSNEISV